MTWRSSIASSSADCTLAGARLISSASSIGAKIGPRRTSKRRSVGDVDRRPEQIARQQVGRELDAPEAEAERLRERAHRRRLGEARHALDQHVAAGEEADQQAVDELALADDDAADLVEELLQDGRRIEAAHRQRPPRRRPARIAETISVLRTPGTWRSRRIAPGKPGGASCARSVARVQSPPFA